MEDQLKEQMLDLLMGSLTNEAKKFATGEIDKIKANLEAELKSMKDNATLLKQEIDKVLADCPAVVNMGTVEKPKKELTHSCFDTVLKVIASAKRKEKNVMLVGGAGGGKTHLVSQIAKTLKLPFYPMSVGMQTTKSDLLGFINATGQYMTSCVRQAYENGGVLLLDEFDSAHAGVITILNSLLANGHCSFPDKIINKHKDFVCVVACNTYGTGANLDYIGRNRLDGATLDRFIVVDVDYDPKLEKRLTKNKEWYDTISKIRKNADSNGLKIIISPRACMDGADLLDAGFSPKEVLKMVVFKGSSEDVVSKLLKGVSLNFGKEKSPFEEESIPNNTPTVTDFEVYEKDDIVLNVYIEEEKVKAINGFDLTKYTDGAFFDYTYEGKVYSVFFKEDFINTGLFCNDTHLDFPVRKPPANISPLENINIKTLVDMIENMPAETSGNKSFTVIFNVYTSMQDKAPIATHRIKSTARSESLPF